MTNQAEATRTEHTPEPWHGHLGTGPGEDGRARLMSADDDILADLRQHSGADAAKNLLRIVACVNACVAIPAETLEQVANDGGGLIHESWLTETAAERDELRERNAALLEALDWALQYSNLRQPGSVAEDNPMHARMLDHALALIAAGKGKGDA